MPLQFSAAHSSRITKPKTKSPLLKRSASSPFAALPRRKAVQRSKSKPDAVEDGKDGSDGQLDDTGLVVALANDRSVRDVVQTLQDAQSDMFDEMPERGGMNSTRIAEVLNFRRNLPPIVTVAHVHALIGSPTAVEREIAALTKTGIIRRLVVPGRGIGGSNAGEGLVLAKDWEQQVSEAVGLGDCQQNSFVDLLRSNPTAVTFPRLMFQLSQATALMRAGFLTASTEYERSPNLLRSAAGVSAGTSTSVLNVSRAASGSLAAVGGHSAFQEAGGGGGGTHRGVSSHVDDQSEPEYQRLVTGGGDFRLSLPNTGPYLRLLTSARDHLMSLLGKSKFREAPLYLLRERWDGGVAHDDDATQSKRARGEFVGVLPGRTRKWKQFYGLRFDWVLAECLGAGLIEVFETGSVGRGVRAVS